jgi:branched-chain amino acid transport system substrate-binding protein
MGLSSAFGKVKIKTITIGIASNFTDVTPNSYNPFGNSVKNGIVMAADKVNEKLNAKGARIVLKEFNYGSDELKVRKIVREGEKSDLIGMIGYEFSSHALLAAPLHQELKFPMITPSASADRISKIGNYVYQGTFNNSYQVEILAKYAVNNLGGKKAAMITASDCAYCEDVANTFKKSYESNGGKIVYDIPILSDQKDFQKALRPYDFEKVDVIIVPNQEMTSARVITYLLKRGINKIFLGGDGWRTLGEIHKTAYCKKLRGYMMAHWAPNQMTEKSQAFVKAYRTRFKGEPTDSAVLGYDAMLMAGEALLSIQDGVYTRESFKTALEKLKTLSGVTGTFIFRKNQAPAKSILLMKSSPHGFVIDKILEPEFR